MGKLSARKKAVKRTVEIGNVASAAVSHVEDLDARIETIQLLIPLGLQAVTDELQQAVVELVGARYQRKASDQPLRRWGSQRGSVYLGDQKLPVEVPRVRNVDDDSEVSLDAYQALQTPRNMDQGLLLRMLKGIATRILRCLCRDGTGGVRPVLIDGVASVCESHGTEAGPIPRTLLGGLRSGGALARRQELCR